MSENSFISDVNYSDFGGKTINYTSVNNNASFFNGLSNSNSIVSQIGHTNSAAALCLNSTNGGQSDWYLPAIEELQILWNNYSYVRRTLSQIVGATQLESNYWSSTERSTMEARYLIFNPATQLQGYSSSKTTISINVRAIRAF